MFGGFVDLGWFIVSTGRVGRERDERTWIADGVQLAFAGQPGFLGLLVDSVPIGWRTVGAYLEQLVYARHCGC